MKRLFNLRLIPLILLGIILAVCSMAYFDKALIIALLIGAVILFLCSIFIKQMKKVRGKLMAVLLAFCVMLGITQLTFSDINHNSIHMQDALIEGKIDILSESDVEGYVKSEGRAEIYLEDLEYNGVKYEGKAVVSIIDGSLLEGYKIGDRIQFRGDISPMGVDIEDSYSVADYTDGIYYYIYADWDSTTEYFLWDNLGNDADWTDKIRLRVKKVLYDNIKPETAGFLYAMTFGDKSGLNEQTKDAFSYTGTAHIFAVSGLHVGIIAGAIVLLLKKCKVRNNIAVFVVVACILLPFCALCEFSPSTVRATVMVLIALASKIFMMRSDAMTNFSLAGVILLVVNPIYLFDLGFLMSFMAVFGLITLSKPLKRLLRKIKCPSKLADALSATLSANIALLPIMLIYFGGQSLLFVIANLFVIPLMAVLFPVYFVIVFVTALLTFTGFLLTAIGWLFTIMIFVVKSISTWNFLIINFELSKVFIALNIIVMLALSKYIMIPRKAKTITASVLLTVFCVGIIGNLNIRKYGETNIYCYEDAGECQLVLIDDRQQGTYLVVNGKADYNAASLTVEKMREYHIDRVDGTIIIGECDEKTVDDIMYMTKCTDLYCYSDRDYRDLPYVVNTGVFEEGFMIGFYNSGTLEIIINNKTVRFLAEGYALKDTLYDVLVCYDIVREPGDGQYVVCEDGYVNSLKNYVPPTFTIKIKGDKIKTSQLWS